MQFISETIYSDGGYDALVAMYGTKFAVDYVHGEVRVRPLGITSYQRTAKAKGMVHTATRQIEREISAKLLAMPEHRAAHLALYA